MKIISTIALDPWDEVTGLLIDSKDNYLIFKEFILEILPCDSVFLNLAKGYHGETVSILRTDSRERTYRIMIS